MTEVGQLTITEFLERIWGEIEAAAKKCAEIYPAPWDVNDRGHSATVKADEPNFWTVAELDQSPAGTPLPGWPGEYLDHIAMHDPDSVLRDIESKRAIVEMHSQAGVAHYCPPIGGVSRVVTVGNCPTLRHLAYAHREHPLFREEWKP